MDRRTFLNVTGKGIVGGSAILSTILSAHPDAFAEGTIPVQDQPRHSENFDSDWRFHLGEVVNGERFDLDDAHWAKLDLPHDWSIRGPFLETNPSGPSGAFLPGGIGWYRKRFVVPEAAKGRHVEIEFGGVYMNSDVWLNGRHLGNRPYGFVSFHYDLSPYLRYGSEENVIAVRVDNSMQPNCRWYSGSGIYRSVQLTTTSLCRVAPWGVFITTPGVSAREATIRVRTAIEDRSDGGGTLRIKTAIHDENGLVVASHEATGTAGASGGTTLEQRIHLTNPQLWSPSSPHMYEAISHLYRNGEVVDRVSTPFGVRWFSFDANRGFSLNGEPMKLKGVCIHGDLGCLGVAYNRREMERRLRLLKDMGCNAIRMAHNPPASDLLDQCDRMGFLVMDEAFDEWGIGKRSIKYGYHLYFDQWGLRDLKSMVMRDRNHPSIILWSVGNEIPGKQLPRVVSTARRLTSFVHGLDPTRPVTSAIDSIEKANQSGFPDVFDVVGYNGGGGSSFEYDKDHARYPKRKIFGSEAPHTAQTRGIYVSDESYCSSYDDCFLRMSSEGSWKLVADRPFIAGQFRWAGIDYLGEPTPHQRYNIPSRPTLWPARSGDNGVIDTCGFPKDIYYFYQSKWTDTPMLHIFPHWNWEGMEGKSIFVWCYTNCDSVELFLNGASLGKQHTATTAAYHLFWQVPYHAGTLKAVGIRGGSPVCHQEIHTAGHPAKIAFTVPSHRLSADGRDVASVEIKIQDENGKFCPSAQNRIHFEVAGEGRLIGVDNGDPLGHASFKGNEMEAFNGLCLAVIQATRKPGKITLRVSSPGLRSEPIVIESELPSPNTSVI